MNLELPIGTNQWRIAVPDAKLVAVSRAEPTPAARPLGELIRDALDRPIGLDSLRRALTPEDRVAIVIDESIPNVGHGLSAILDHIASAGIAMESVTLISPPGSQSDDWIDELPDEYSAVRTEVHDPDDRNHLAYLATTKSGRRIYLNRTLVEADFVIVLAARRRAPRFGVSGAEDWIFPMMSDAEARAELRLPKSKEEPTPAHESSEVAWLLGMPFFIQVLDNSQGPLDVIAGLPDSTQEGVRRHNAIWTRRIACRPDLILATLAPDARFKDVALAARTCSRIVAETGRIAVLAPPIDISGEGVSILRQHDDARDAMKQLLRVKPDDTEACRQWATASTRARLYLANSDEDLAEEIFATALGNERELERLLESSHRVLHLHQAERCLVEVED